MSQEEFKAGDVVRVRRMDGLRFAEYRRRAEGRRAIVERTFERLCLGHPIRMVVVRFEPKDWRGKPFTLQLLSRDIAKEAGE